MPICYIVPGLLGSTLSSDQVGDDTVWVSYTALILGQMGQLRLAADGITPGPPDGVQLYAQSPLSDYYATVLTGLQSQLGSSGYTIIPYGYDWRYALLSLGASLAAAIAGQVDPAIPCTIVAHSYGGLVARAAWSVLAAEGKQGLVRRLVTLGTPHQGSYAVVALWSLDSQSLLQLSALAAIGAPLAPLQLPPLRSYLWSPPQIAQVSGTWPAFYACLPSLGGAAAAADPARSQLYTATNWLSPIPSQAWLDYARDTVSPFLLSPASLPPANVLTTMAGVGVPTRDGLVSPALLGTPAAYGSTGAGDGTVTTLSALIPQSVQYELPATHADLLGYAVSSGTLAAEILTQRSAPMPPPPLQSEPGTIAPLLAGPPVPSLLFPARGMAGDC